MRPIARKDGSKQPVTSRDLRTLSVGDLVSLLRKDARELDARLEAKREERGGLVPLYCCNRYLGQFMPSSRVRCPVCKVWRRPTA